MLKMKIQTLSIAATLVCMLFVIVSSLDSTVTTSTISGRRRLRLGRRCFVQCRRPNIPAECNCSALEDCKTKQCGEGEKCQMIKGVFPMCLKDKSVCDLPKSSSPCDATTRRYFYNKDTQRCERFGQRECGGNLNVFRNRRQCFMTCRRRPDRAVCDIPKKTTVCDKTPPGYYYNNDTQRCVQFSQGECGGNANMFTSKRRCVRTCLVRRPRFPPKTT